MKRNLVIEIISSLLILLFVYTGINKFLAIDSVKLVLKQYPLIGSMPNIIAWGLPITELVVAILLFIPRTRLRGFYASLLLMTAFTLYLGYMLIFTTKLPCTCGGMLQKLSWPQHFVFNIFFVLLSLAGIFLIKKQAKQKQENERPQVVFT